jgi:hypothetical protein
LKTYKSSGTNQTTAELTQSGHTLRSDIHIHINSILNKEELPEQRKESIIVRKKSD